MTARGRNPISIELDHPAYDWLYLALAVDMNCKFVTADERFLRKRGQGRRRALRVRAVSLVEAAKR
jgi:predicted nucleic acid-binding protein